MKKLIASIATLMMLFGLITLGNAEAISPAGQYYAYQFEAEGYGTYTFFFHFYEDDPVIGSVFYAGLSNNRINYAGLYSVEEVPYEYACFADRDSVVAGGDKQTGTAPYTIHFLDWDGTEIDSCGWDGEILYNDCRVITGSGSGPVLYHLDREGLYQDKFAEEVGMPYMSFVSVDDPTSTVSLCHNKTYVDMMQYYIDGNWSISEENGQSVYTLTPFDEDEDTVALTVAADQKTAVYTGADGEEVQMVNTAAEAAAILYTGEGVFHVSAYNTDADVTLNLFDNGTCDLTVALFGNSSVFDQGTYTMQEDHSITFDFENAGQLNAPLDMSIMGVVLNYQNENTQLGAMEVSLPVHRLEQETPAAALLMSFTGGYTTFDVYDNGTYQFEFANYSLKESGTWTFENYQFSITQSNGNVIKASLDETYAMSFEYVAEANAQLKDTFTAARDVWGPALAH